jgi:2-methylcitrate dehydratase
MVYIVATLLRKALQQQRAGWKQLMLEPADYSASALADPLTRALMDKIEFAHGGPEYDKRYPDGIPTGMVITDADGTAHDSGLVMYPAGHARNTTADLRDILAHKFRLLAALAAPGDADALVTRFTALARKSADDINTMHDFVLPAGARFA